MCLSSAAASLLRCCDPPLAFCPAPATLHSRCCRGCSLHRLPWLRPDVGCHPALWRFRSQAVVPFSFRRRASPITSPPFDQFVSVAGYLQGRNPNPATVLPFYFLCFAGFAGQQIEIYAREFSCGGNAAAWFSNRRLLIKIPSDLLRNALQTVQTLRNARAAAVALLQGTV
jgi:hypothetical protein